LLLYAYTFDDIVNHNRTLNVMSQDVATFQTYAGIDYEIFTVDAFRYEVATLHAQTVLTMFSALAGLLLVLFVEPPVHWFVGGDKFSGDFRPTLLAFVLFLVLCAVMAIPPLRQFWELLPLEWVDYAFIGVAVLMWILTLRYVWRERLFERFLKLEAMVGIDEEWLVEELEWQQERRRQRAERRKSRGVRKG
ncbi:MAG: hypothetical protein K8S97_12280, partial [Anaerolineae bacterium]|nr:hypothetical protein [Anaerolineae bacterium]